jgi:hypothetical protein
MVGVCVGFIGAVGTELPVVGDAEEADAALEAVVCTGVAVAAVVTVAVEVVVDATELVVGGVAEGTVFDAETVLVAVGLEGVAASIGFATYNMAKNVAAAISVR